MKAIVLAAGLGTRLRPITDNIPKALVPFADGTLLSTVICKLRNSGFDDIVVNAHHFADKIVSYLAGNGNFGTGVRVSLEKDLLDTGGALRKAAPMLRGDGRFLIHNVDIVSNLDLAGFVQGTREDAISTLLVSDRQTSRYLLFDDEMRLVGWTNVKTGEVRSGFPGLDVSKCRKLAFDGIHCMTDKALDLMEPYPEAFPVIDFYLKQAVKYPVYGYVSDGLKIMDVGKLDSLEEAKRLYSTM